MKYSFCFILRFDQKEFCVFVYVIYLKKHQSTIIRLPLNLSNYIKHLTWGSFPVKELER